MKKTLDANQLKLIAIFAMTVDHIAWLLFPGYAKGALPVVMHIIGRLTCPIMCYFIAEGYYHTRNINKYTFRLFLFAVISHFAYIFASNDFVDAPFVHPVLFREHSEPDERHVAACVGACHAARREQRALYAAAKDASGGSHLSGQLPERLELHRKPVRAGLRHEPKRSEGAGAVDAVFCGALRGRVFLRARQALRRFAAGRCAVPGRCWPATTASAEKTPASTTSSNGSSISIIPCT